MAHHINPRLKQQRSSKKTADLFAGLRAGKTADLAQAITLIESRKAGDHQEAQALLQQLLPFTGKSFRLGITGVPGVGKSTFIESLGLSLIAEGKKVAVLAIDPSSQRTRGSILGDKTRMEELVKSDAAFIRPSPAGDSLGGVARKTRESIALCEAAGYDFIIVETVGVGQSETAVHSMTDFFLLLKLAGAGDDLQGIKRGIMEMADAVIINKADGDNAQRAKHAQREFKNALHMLPPKAHQYPIKVHRCSGLHGDGVDEVKQELYAYKQHSMANGYLAQRRKEQSLYWLHETIEHRLQQDFYQSDAVRQRLPLLEQDVLQHKITPFEAAQRLFND